MKGLILSGGRGTRLRPITHTGAKQLLPIANKPILFYAIEAMRDAGIKDIAMIVGDTHAEVEAAVGGGERWGVNVTYVRQEAPLGLAHAVKIARPHLEPEPFVMFLGDNLLKDGVRALVEDFEKDKPNSQILLAKVSNPQEFGVAELSGDRVVRLEEKPKQPKSDLALVGVYIFDRNIFDVIENLKPSARGELEITDAIQGLIDRGFVVKHRVVSGWWKDTGKLEDVLEANRLVLDSLETAVRGEVDDDSELHGRVVVESGARVINSVIRGPVVIGEDCVIENSYIGSYTSIDHGARIVGSEIEHSVVLAEAVVENLGVRVEGSLIGRNAVVKRDGRKPSAYRFMIGDYSQVSVV